MLQYKKLTICTNIIVIPSLAVKEERAIRGSVAVRVGNLNVVTMPGKARELANMMERRKVEVYRVCS